MSLPAFMENPDPSVFYSDNYVVLDFETTGLEHGSALIADNRIVLAAWLDRDGGHYKFGGELEQGRLVTACSNADFIVAHNAKFELQWLDRCGFDIGSKPVFCTQNAEWVLSGNRSWRLRLEDCARRRKLGGKDSLVSLLIKAGVCPSDIPKSLLLKYCIKDVNLTERLFKAQRAETEGTRLLPVIFTRGIVIAPLADIEKNGLHLDATRVEEEYATTLAEYTRTMEEMDELTGGINPRSPAQVAEFVYGELGFAERLDRKGKPIRNKKTKKFPDGAPKTDEDTLLSLKATTPEQLRFMELKKRQGQLSSALDKNLSMFLGACREHDGMIYGELVQGRTVTHRLASSGRRTYYRTFDDVKGCQFQNLPRIYKKLFSARLDGWLVIEADGSQLEFRVAGHLGRDDVILGEIEEGYDVHSFTREVISKAGGVEITRTDAKPHTFKPLYGGVSGTPAERAYYEAFGEKYHSLKETQDNWCLEVGNNKMLETEWGMRFYWPNAAWSRDGWLNCKTQVYNTPVQSLATAEIIPIGLAYCWHRTRDHDLFIVNTVHDSIIAEVPPHERELFKEAAVQSLTTDVYEYLYTVYGVKFSVPLGVGMVAGTHWGQPLPGEDEESWSVPIPRAADARHAKQEQWEKEEWQS